MTYAGKIKYLLSKGWKRKCNNGKHGVWYEAAPYRHVIPINRAVELEQWIDDFFRKKKENA